MRVTKWAHYTVFESTDLSKLMKELADGNWKMKELHRGKPHRMRVVAKKRRTG